MRTHGMLWLSLALFPFFARMLAAFFLFPTNIKPMPSRWCNHTAECVKSRRSKETKADYTRQRLKSLILKSTGQKKAPTVRVNSKGTIAAPKPQPSLKHPAKSPIFVRSSTPKSIRKKRVIQFKLNNNGVSYNNFNVLGVDLWVHLKKRHKTTNAKRITIRVSSVASDGTKGKIISKLRVKVKKNWQKIGIRLKTAAELMKNPQKPLFLHIRCKCSRRKGVKLILKQPKRLPRGVGANSKMPFLVIRGENKPPVRAKRDLSVLVNCGTNITRSPCCEHLYYLNFTAQNWSIRVIAPEGFVQTKCRGRCGATTEERRTLPAVRRRCRPTRREDLRLIYIDDNQNPRVTVLRRYLKRDCRCVRRSRRRPRNRISRQPF